MSRLSQSAWIYQIFQVGACWYLGGDFRWTNKKAWLCLGGFMQGMVHTGPQLCGDYTKLLLGDGNSKIFWNLGVFWVLLCFFFLCVKQFGPPGPTVLWILFKQNQRCLEKMENYFDPQKERSTWTMEASFEPPVFPTKKPMGLTCAMGTSSEPFWTQVSCWISWRWHFQPTVICCDVWLMKMTTEKWLSVWLF